MRGNIQSAIAQMIPMKPASASCACSTSRLSYCPISSVASSRRIQSFESDQPKYSPRDPDQIPGTAGNRIPVHIALRPIGQLLHIGAHNLIWFGDVGEAIRDDDSDTV